MNEIKEYTEKLFEDIKHIDENGNEYWLGRELQQVLVYKEWRKFNNVINKAIIACNNSKMMIGEHFVQVDKTIRMPRNASKIINDYKLSRYACYLIVQNADSKKEVIALG